jgi:hypothetical protein
MFAFAYAAVAGADVSAAEAAPSAQQTFRSLHLPRIEAQGWQYVTSVGSSGKLDADVFIQDVRQREGSIRSAWVLKAHYERIEPIWTLKVPYQSIRILYWFDCSDLSGEGRQSAGYTSVDGTGYANEPTSIPTSQPARLEETAPGSLLRLLASTACK